MARYRDAISRRELAVELWSSEQGATTHPIVHVAKVRQFGQTRYAITLADSVECAWDGGPPLRAGLISYRSPNLRVQLVDLRSRPGRHGGDQAAAAAEKD